MVSADMKKKMKENSEQPEVTLTDRNSRMMRPTNSVHFGDVDFEVDENIMDASWGEVMSACCSHTGQEWAFIAVGICAVVFFLYFFLFGLELLGTAAKVMGGCRAGALFGDETNPIAGLMIGIIATVLLQSSSTTTSIVVSLVGPTISVNQGIYMIMGSNIGTSVTNTIVALAQMGDGDQLERAFAGATVHDLFNFLTVLCLLPLEVVTHYLARITSAMVANATLKDGEKWEGPIKHLVAPLGSKIIIANKAVVSGIATKGLTCPDFYPIVCEDDVISAKTCSAGLIGCDKKTNTCPAFFDTNATVHDDQVSGGVCFFIALVIMFLCLMGLVYCLQKLLLGMSTRIVYKATNVNGYLGILIGCGITIVVQSSSITTSALTPLVGMGVIRLEQMLPLTLGANIGTTLTALMASMVASGTESLQVALAHLFFNITGIIIWYPIPFMRRIPLNGARLLGKATRIWRGFPILYIFMVFIVIPLIFLGLSALFEEKTIGLTVLGSFLTVLLFMGLVYTGYWCQYKDGKQKLMENFQRRERRRSTMESLPEDMEYLKNQVAALIDHTGLPQDDDNNEVDVEENIKDETPKEDEVVVTPVVDKSSEDEVAA